jgi:HPt (histidine-containing phosphotransfer) domain-containing protein
LNDKNPIPRALAEQIGLTTMAEAVLEDKEELEQEFLAFLHGGGFPEDSIFRGPCFQIPGLRTWRRALFAWFGRLLGAEREDEGSPCYVDMAILDLETREYVALIEFRLQITDEIETEIAQFFRGTLNCIAVKPPVFLISPSLTSGSRICQLRENGNWQKLPQRSFPSYATLVAGHSAERTFIDEASRGRALDHFTVTCHALAGVLALISLASLGRLASLTDNEMLLLGLAALLIIAPHSIGIRISNANRKPRLVRAREAPR